jgi:hypothetical protein
MTRQHDLEAFFRITNLLNHQTTQIVDQERL